MNLFEKKIDEAAALLKSSRFTSAFTGAGISVESGISPFRGEGGLWSKYDPILFDINYFQQYPEKSWVVIKEIFYDDFAIAKPNTAHYILAKMEANNLLNAVITQNIDHLHQDAGSKTVFEFHGNSRQLISMDTGKVYSIDEIDLEDLPPRCKETGEVLKPDFIFFGEGIPQDAYLNSVNAANKSEVCLVIGTTGEVMPASQIPIIAKQNNAKIIEVNVKPSKFTHTITDIYLEGNAQEIMDRLYQKLVKFA